MTMLSFALKNEKPPAVVQECMRLLSATLFGMLLMGVMAFFLLLPSSVRAAGDATSAEMKTKSAWVSANLLAPGKKPPFSFNYGKKTSLAFLRSSQRDIKKRVLDADRTEYVVSWSHPDTGLEVRCVAVDYRDYPVVEWTVYLKNGGKKKTTLLDHIQGLDLLLQRDSGSEFVLHGMQGDSCTAQSYQPYEIELGPGNIKTYSPPTYSGKSTDGPEGWPYYNLQMPGGGIILAVGWPGQWASSFTRKGAKSLQIQAGQQLTHLYLKPGEEIRTPRITLLFWQGEDTIRAQNLWRRWYLDHVIPRLDGKPPGPQKQIQVSGNNPAYVQSFLDAGIRPDICWRDAGGATTWYPSKDGPYTGTDAWLNTGTWEIDTTKYPKGFKPFSDWVHDHSMKFLLWFEPERVGSLSSWLGTNHPEWLLPSSESTVGSILNLGNPAAQRWLVNHVHDMIKSQGLDWYREDMNGGGPLPAWRDNDAEDRQGITENFYVQGHLAFWDELIRRNPGLRIDSCASGGRRNDLETMRRAVPLLRSDLQWPDKQQQVILGNQCQTYGLSSWLPFQGTGVYRYDPYSFRSSFMASFGMGSLTKENRTAQQQAYAECAKIGPAMLFGDYYPLTPYSLAEDVWIGWQFHRPEIGEGCVQAFRRAACLQPSIKLALRGLDPAKAYEVTDFDKPDKQMFTGKELMNDGLSVQLEARGSAVLFYRVKPPTNSESGQSKIHN